jgi:hypothetical protein
MRQAGLWDRIKVSEVTTNLQTGVIEKEGLPRNLWVEKCAQNNGVGLWTYG